MRKKLGIRSPLQSDADLVALVEERLPVGAISALIEHRILEKEMHSVIVLAARSSSDTLTKRT